MTVAELMAELAKMPQDAPVVVYVAYKNAFGQAYDFAESVGVAQMAGNGEPSAVVRIANVAAD